jgi:hypothetical protein
MVDDINIIRNLTEAEQQDMVEVGRPNLLTLFLKKLTEKRTEYHKKYQPYDSYSARIDFEDKIKAVSGDLISAVDKSKVNTRIDIKDLDKYGNPDRFELVDVKETVEDKLIDSMRQSFVTGKEFWYKGKQRGNSIVIFVPNNKLVDVEKWVDENFSDKKVKSK